MSGRLTKVEAIVEPYNRTQDLYQSYYRESLAAYCGGEKIDFQEAGSRFTPQLRFLARLRASKRFQETLPQPLFQRLIDAAARVLGASRVPRQAVGSYVFRSGSDTLRVCIDALDSGDIQGNALEENDLYFKTNYWSDRDYPVKVLPLANLNPYVLNRREQFEEFREAPKDLDLFAFFRVWGGSNEVEGVEHNLTLFETLAQINCRKRLLAYLVAGDIKAAATRLEKAGVEWTTEWMPLQDLWRQAARSRLNIVRLGMHECVPWRMTDILAMGGCPVVDYSPRTRWHVPLAEQVNYLNLNIPWARSGPVRFDPHEVADKVRGWLASTKQIDAIGRNNRVYFDENLAPEKLGAYIARAAKDYLVAAALSRASSKTPPI